MDAVILTALFKVYFLYNKTEMNKLEQNNTTFFKTIIKDISNKLFVNKEFFDKWSKSPA